MKRHRNRGITRALLTITKDIELQIQALTGVGVTVLGLESIQLELVSSILHMNGIRKNDEFADLVASPIFDYTLGKVSIEECLKGMAVQLEQLSKQRGMELNEGQPDL